MPITAEAVGLSTSGLERARDYVDACVERGEIAGAVMLAARHGQIAQLEAVGRRDLEAALPMELDTIFRMASMTKPIVSVGALRLIEDGRLNLDDPIARYLPEFADTKAFAGVEDGRAKFAALERPITVYHLLTHTSGLAYDAPDPALEPYDTINTPGVTLIEVVQRLAARPLAHQPGSDWSYGWSHDVLGRVIEVVTGTTLGDYLQAVIFAPLKMPDTGFYAPLDNLTRLASIYEKTDAGLQLVPSEDGRIPPLCERGGGGLVSTIGDYYRFAAMLLNRGELDGVRLLQPETVDLMTRNHLTGSLRAPLFGSSGSIGGGYGLGVGVDIQPATSAFSGSEGAYHWGGSWNTHFWIDPVRQLIGIFMVQYVPFSYSSISVEYRLLIHQALTD